MRSLVARWLLLSYMGWWISGCAPVVYQQKSADGPPDFAHSDLRNVPDAIPRAEVLCSGCARPYVIAGERYVPLSSNRGYRERGDASWYGTAFHGKPTATGERYDMFAMTAAHKTLLLPSYVRVRNLQNGREVTVKVNDRGPFRAGRIIDLSYAAAVKLGIDKTGSAAVEVVAVPGETAVLVMPSMPLQAVAALPVGGYFQAGAFAERQNAVGLQLKLVATGVEPVAIVKVEVDGRTLHRVRVGPVATDIESLVIAKLRDLGYSAIKLVSQ